MADKEKDIITSAPSTDELTAELQFNFGIHEGMVTVDFGKMVKWIGLPPVDAIRFAELMLSTARQAIEDKAEATPGG